jgi:hypothetical protein
VDLDGDGHNDILTGSWPGELFLFRGGVDGFAAPEMLKDKDGEYINIGGGIKENADGSILITGHGEFEEVDGGWIVKYHGRRMKSSNEKPISVTGTASAAHAVDWEGDGDYDILVGDIGGNVYLIPNLGTPQSYVFGEQRQLKAGGQDMKVEGDAGPYTADWDGDGDFDVLVGAGDGSVSLFLNAGSEGEPKFVKAEKIISGGDTTYGPDAPKEPRRGVRSKVCVADWNGDGLLDLLVGDFATQKPDLPEPSADEKAEHDKIRKELVELNNKFGELISKVHGPKRVQDEEEYKKVQEELKEHNERSSELRAKLPPEYETHGWVWLFIQRSN